ncbi:UGSC family (seleno)protein [Natronorubrum sp. FCH18a]|uniref:UGSC family (seleno)protein n=1 Tax=Natronorubrum sp. FCH18a TaxID=3447018 RepID=UPI003F518533
MSSENGTDDGTNVIEVLDPTGSVTVSSHGIAPRVDSLDGTTIGLLDNSKSNANVLLDEIGTVLVEEYGVEDTVYRRKDKSPIPADDLADQLHSQCDAVVNAYGDCGSCTSWCVYDSTDLEKKGTPVATINTDEFVKLGQSESQSLGMPGLPIVTIPHPMGDLREEAVHERARNAVPELVTVLTTDREQLMAEYENKYLDADEELNESDLYCPI